MKSIRERVEKFANKIDQTCPPGMTCEDLIESFAREMRAEGRNEGLEEAAKELETYGLQLFREVENYPLSRAGVVLSSFAVKIQALKTDAKQATRIEND